MILSPLAVAMDLTYGEADDSLGWALMNPTNAGGLVGSFWMTPSYNITVTSMHAYLYGEDNVGPPGADQRTICAIYEYVDTDDAGVLIGVSDESTVLMETIGWVDYPCSTPISLLNDTLYFLVCEWDYGVATTAVQIAYYFPGVWKGIHILPHAYGAPPNPLAGEAGDMNDYLIYADYSVNTSVVIDGGASSTTDDDVVLTMDAPWAVNMSFSDDNITWSAWTPYSSSYNYTLPCVLGLHTVYANFTDGVGYEFANDSIWLNCTFPGVAVTGTINPPAQHFFNLSINTTDYANYSFVIMDYADSLPLATSTLGTPDSVNGTWSTWLIDLSYYIPFMDMYYELYLNITDLSTCGFSNLTLLWNGTLGTPPGLLYHVSFKNFNMMHENYTNLPVMNDGYMFDVASNFTTPVTYTIFLTDWSNNVLTERTGETFWDVANIWARPLYFIQWFEARDFYKVFIGFDYNTYNGSIQFDDLYCGELGAFTDLGAFSYVYNTTNNTFQIMPGYTYGEEVFTGVQLRFGTFDIGETIPFHSIGLTMTQPDKFGSTWGSRFTWLDTQLGVEGTGIVFALLIIALCSLIPILILRAIPPLPIMALFSSFGVVLSYNMGLFPQWIFIVVLIGILMFIFFRIFKWAREQPASADVVDRPEGQSRRSFLKDEGTGERVTLPYRLTRAGARTGARLATPVTKTLRKGISSAWSRWK